MHTPQMDKNSSEDWKRSCREMLAADQNAVKAVLQSVIHEFMVPLTQIQAYAELIRDYVPDVPINMPADNSLTVRDLVSKILQCAAQQQMMFDFVRSEVWSHEQTTD